ncbi:cupin domain-containing protein [Stappia sp.]|uniref:cupin domain-containing protein n=1 Tax=Stappia sp. TaxID=1870903 RepID=UPI003C7CDD37
MRQLKRTDAPQTAAEPDVERQKNPAEPDDAGAVSPLAYCIGGMDATRFFAAHWEKKPLVVDGRGRTPPDLLSLTEIDRILQFEGLKAPHFRVFSAGQAVPERELIAPLKIGSDSVSGVALPARIYERLARGDSLALQFLEKIRPAIRRFCADLEREIGVDCQANSYLTFPNTQTLHIHYDMHDVFVVQLSGRKHWRIWDDPVPLPLRRPDKARHAASVERRVRGAALIFDGEVRPGDVLYIPRGYVHCAEARAEHSLHLTVGLLVERIHGVLERRVERLLARLADDQSMRRSARQVLAGPDGRNALSDLIRAAGREICASDASPGNAGTPVSCNPGTGRSAWSGRLLELSLRLDDPECTDRVLLVGPAGAAIEPHHLAVEAAQVLAVLTSGDCRSGIAFKALVADLGHGSARTGVIALLQSDLADVQRGTA